MSAVVPISTANIGPVTEILHQGNKHRAVTVPAGLIGSPAAAMHVYAYLKHQADLGKPMPKNASIAKACGISPSVVSRALNWLRQEGYCA